MGIFGLPSPKRCNTRCSTDKFRYISFEGVGGWRRGRNPEANHAFRITRTKMSRVWYLSRCVIYPGVLSNSYHPQPSLATIRYLENHSALYARTAMFVYVLRVHSIVRKRQMRVSSNLYCSYTCHYTQFQSVSWNTQYLFYSLKIEMRCPCNK